MIFVLIVLLLSVSQIHSMQVEESLSYDYTPIAVVNECPYPIIVTLDASKFKSDVDSAQLPFTQEYPGHTETVVEANATKELFFWRLIYCKESSGCQKTLSTLSARINLKDVSPSHCCSVNLEPDYSKRLIVSHNMLL